MYACFVSLPKTIMDLRALKVLSSSVAVTEILY